MNRMVQGARTSSAQFQKVMNEVLADEISSGAILCYQDDILVHSASEEEHLTILETLFRKLQSVDLAARPSKCFFFQKKVTFLGHKITGEGATPLKDKLQAMETFPSPNSVKQVRSFLGSINFYRRFIPNIAQKAAPLYNLLKKNKGKFKWDDTCESAFKTLKSDLCKSPLLIHPDFEKTFFVKCDASSIAVGGVLEQKDEEGFFHPIAYCSKTLNKAERNYSVIEKEALALVHALEHFRHLIYGYKIIVKSDHKPLTFLFNLKQKNQRIIRWLLAVQEFNIEIVHLAGKENVVADMLSRSEEARNAGLINSLQIIQPISVDLIKDHQSKDQSIINLKQALENDNSSSDEHFIDETGIVYKKIKNGKRSWNYRVLVPQSLVPHIISIFHSNAKSGHFGLRKVLWKIRMYFTWAGMNRDITHFLKTCEMCQFRNVQRKRIPFQPQTPPSYPFQKLSIDFLGPFERSRGTGNKYILLFMDLFTRFPIVVTTRDMEANTVAKAYIENVYSVFGGSEFILTDRGANFTGKVFKELCKLLRITHLSTTSFHPQSNGASERLNRVILNILSHLCEGAYDTWESLIPYALREIRCSVHKSLGDSPHFLLFGSDPIDCSNELTLGEQEEYHNLPEYIQQMLEKSETVKEVVELNLLQSSKTNCNYRNKGVKEPNFCLGDKVLLLESPSFSGKNQKLARHYKGVYRIIELRGPVNAKIRSITNQNDIQTVHLEKLKHYHERTIFNDTQFLSEIKGGPKSKSSDLPTWSLRETRQSKRIE